MNPQNESPGLFSKLIGDIPISTEVGLSKETLLMVFITAALVILAWFAFKKLFN